MLKTPKTTRNTAAGAGMPLLRTQKTEEELMMARKPANKRGTRMGSAAFIPATTMIKPAAGITYLLSGEDAEEVDGIVIEEVRKTLFFPGGKRDSEEAVCSHYHTSFSLFCLEPREQGEVRRPHRFLSGFFLTGLCGKFFGKKLRKEWEGPFIPEWPFGVVGGTRS